MPVKYLKHKEIDYYDGQSICYFRGLLIFMEEYILIGVYLFMLRVVRRINPVMTQWVGHVLVYLMSAMYVYDIRPITEHHKVDEA